MNIETMHIDPERAEILMEKVKEHSRQSNTPTMVNRLLCISYICANVEPREIKRLTGYGLTSINKACKAIQEGREDELFVIKGGGRNPKLTPDQEQQVIGILDKECFFTLQQIANMIEERFKVKLSMKAVRRLLFKHKLTKYKCGSLPAKADPVAQKTFYDTVINPLMEKAKADSNTVLLFVDAAHFVIGCDFLGGIWSRTRRFIRTFSGRQRHNVLGALDFVTKKILTVENDSYINAESVCDLLTLIHETYQGKEVHLVLDNARYQKCSIVTDLAQHLGIILDYLPSYSPNLNLIERLWRFVKSELRQRFYSDFSEFKARIAEIIASTQTSNRSRIESLIDEKVQLFDGEPEQDPHGWVFYSAKRHGKRDCA